MRHEEMLIGGHFIGGPCDQATPKSIVRNPYDNSIVGSYADGGRSELDAAIQCAHEAFLKWRKVPVLERQRLLRKVASEVMARHEELTELLTLEAGKPWQFSKGEVMRLALTFSAAADALENWHLESVSVEGDPRGKDYEAGYQRFPIGVIFGIVPYNWPLNLAAHKIAPAFAAGNSIVIKPSPLAPLCTMYLCRILHECGVPPGVINVVPCSPKDAEEAIANPLVAMLSFTGSPKVGWHLKEKFSTKRVALELGGDASVIVMDDAELSWAIQRIVSGGYGYAGQICISIQHVLVQSGRYDEVRTRLQSAISDCKCGDPHLHDVVCGPLIDGKTADRVEEWIEEAIQLGATPLVRGTRKDNMVPPALLENVPAEARLAKEEVFGPVLTLSPFKTLDEAIETVNRSLYGIHCGVFTSDQRVAQTAFRDLEVGGVIINDYPTLRFDNLPYGGVKRSGFGREGVRFAMEEMSELKSLVSRLPQAEQQ